MKKGQAALLAALAKRRAAEVASVGADGRNRTGQLIEELSRAIRDLTQVRTRIMASVVEEICACLSLSDLRTLCLLLNLNHESIPHNTQGELAVALLTHAEMNHIVVELLDEITTQWPHVRIP